jgi:hypothetical protein
MREDHYGLEEGERFPLPSYYPDTANYMRFWRDGRWELDNPTEEELKEIAES